MLLLCTRLAGRVRVVGPSMAPTLVDGDRVLVNYLAYIGRRPRPGDVVLACLAAVPGGWTIKRVADRRPAGPGAAGGCSAPDDRHVILLGDHPAASTDSRTFGAVTRAQIRGRVWYRYWPPQRRGLVT